MLSPVIHQPCASLLLSVHIRRRVLDVSFMHPLNASTSTISRITQHVSKNLKIQKVTHPRIYGLEFLNSVNQESDTSMK
jgi:hypothetical protein